MAINLKSFQRYFILTPILALGLMINLISCDCGPQGNQQINGDNKEETNEEINARSLKMGLVPPQSNQDIIILVTFELTEPGKKVDLTNFRLKATITKQVGGSGSKLTYKDAAGNPQDAEKLDKPLTHFTSLTSLQDNDSPLKIAFKVVPNKDVTWLAYQIEAFDPNGKSIGSYPGEYTAWQEEKIQIQNLYPFVGNNSTTFSLCNAIADINHSQLTIELASNNKAIFTLIDDDGHEVGNSSDLDKLIGGGTTTANEKTDLIYFKLRDADTESSAQVTVRVVKRGSNKELATQTVMWQAKGLSLELRPLSGHNFCSDQNPYSLVVENKGITVNTDKIKVRFINNNNVAFKLDNWSASTTAEAELKDITKLTQLEERKTISFNIQQDGTLIPNLYGTNLVLELLDEREILLSRTEIRWINETKINKELKPIIDSYEQLKNEFNQNLKSYTDASVTTSKPQLDYDAALNAIKEIIRIREELKKLVDKLKAELPKMYTQLKQENEKNINEINDLIKEADMKIEEFAEAATNKVEEFSNQATKCIENLKKATDPIDIGKHIAALDQALVSIHTMLGYVMAIANAYNTEATKDFAKQAQKIATATDAAAQQAKEEAAKKNPTADYIEQIKTATTIAHAIKVARNLLDSAPFDTKHRGQQAYKEALHAYYLIIEKAYNTPPPHLNISEDELGSIVEGAKTSINKINDRTGEPTEQFAITLGYATILMGHSNFNRNLKYKIIWMYNNLQYIERFPPQSKEAEEVIRQAKEDIETLKREAETTLGIEIELKPSPSAPWVHQ